MTRGVANLAGGERGAADSRRLAVIVVNFNTREHLRACLATVVAECPARVVVADNGSSDGSVEMVAERFPGVEVSVDHSNPGYGAAANRGIRACRPADVLLLNSDTRLAPGALSALETYARAHPTAGIVAPRLLNVDGTLQRSTFAFPSPLHPQFQHDPLAALLRHVPVLRDHSLLTWSHDRARAVPWVKGAALLIRHDAFLAVGGFDEAFFMYAEEVDLSWRMRAAGWATHFAPVTDVIHEGGVSTAQWRTEMLAEFFSSSHRFLRVHYTGVALGAALAILRTSVALRLARDCGRYVLANRARRRELAENVRVWRGLLLRESTAPSR